MKNDLPIITDENGRDSKGRFTIDNLGKPKGATNKNSRDVKDFIVNFLNDKAYEIPHIWDALEDKDKVSMYLHLAKLVLPKVTDEENDKTLNAPPEIVFKNYNLTAEQARAMAKRLDEEY